MLSFKNVNCILNFGEMALSKATNSLAFILEAMGGLYILSYIWLDLKFVDK